jgi:predicted AAA+ superfamily ATPase
MNYHSRLIAEKLTTALQTFPVVVLAGARQTGKSTLIRNENHLRKRPYFSCDVPQIFVSIQAWVEECLNSKPVISLDEAQRVPQLFPALKRMVDENRTRGRYLISGSAQFLLLDNLSDSLAGRAGYVRISPVTVYELLESKGGPALYKLFDRQFDISCFSRSATAPWSDSWMARGGYPEVAWNPSINARLWFEAYEATYLERDIRDLAAHLDPLAYQRFLRIAASRNGSLLNQSSIAQDAGLTNMTCGRYIHLLEISGLINRIVPFHNNIGKRYVKSPKLLFNDVALAAHLAGIPQALENEKHPQFGPCVESFVMQNLLALADAYLPGQMKLYHLRTASGFEIDAILEVGGELAAVEIKSSRTIDKGSAANLVKFMETSKACKVGIVAYRGDQLLPLGKNIWAVPIAALLS